MKGISGETVVKSFTDEDYQTLDVTNIDGAKFETVVLRRNFDTATVYCMDGEVRKMTECDIEILPGALHFILPVGCATIIRPDFCGDVQKQEEILPV